MNNKILQLGYNTLQNLNKDSNYKNAVKYNENTILNTFDTIKKVIQEFTDDMLNKSLVVRQTDDRYECTHKAIQGYSEELLDEINEYFNDFYKLHFYDFLSKKVTGLHDNIINVLDTVSKSITNNYVQNIQIKCSDIYDTYYNYSVLKENVNIHPSKYEDLYLKNTFEGNESISLQEYIEKAKQ